MQLSVILAFLYVYCEYPSVFNFYVAMLKIPASLVSFYWIWTCVYSIREYSKTPLT